MKTEQTISLTAASTSRTLMKSLSLNIVSNLLLYIGHLIIARRLLREDYATFVVVVSFVSLAALFADLGLMGLFIRKFAEAEAQAAAGKKDTRGELLGTIMALRIMLAVLISAVVVLITPLLGYPLETRHLMMIMLVTFFISSRLVIVRSVGEAFLRGANKYHIVALLVTVDALVFASVLYFYSGKILDLESAIWIYSFCHLPGFLLLVGIIYRDAQSIGFHLKFRFATLRSIIAESLPFILSTAFLTIHSQADPLLLDKLSTPKEVSALGAGLRVLSAILFLPAVFSAILGPPVTQATVSGEFEMIRMKIDRSLRLLLLVALLIAIILSASSDLIMGILFGAGKYSDAAPLVTIFGWTFIPICFGAFFMDIAVAEGRYWLPVLYTFILMITSVTCDIFLIPRYGALGVAIAKCIAVSLGAIALFLALNNLKVVDRKKILLFFLQLAGVVLCSLGVTYILNFWRASPLFILCSVLITSPLIAVFLFKIISFREIWIFVSGFFSKPNPIKKS